MYICDLNNEKVQMLLNVREYIVEMKYICQQVDYAVDNAMWKIVVCFIAPYVYLKSNTHCLMTTGLSFIRLWKQISSYTIMLLYYQFSFMFFFYSNKSSSPLLILLNIYMYFNWGFITGIHLRITKYRNLYPRLFQHHNMIRWSQLFWGSLVKRSGSN